MNTRTKVILSFLLIFLVGFASGYLIKGTFSLRNLPAFDQDRRSEQRMQPPRDMSQSERMERGRNRLAGRLELTDEQQRQFFPAMQEYTSELRQTIRQNREDEHNYVLQRYSEFREQISETLNDEQLIRMDHVLHPDTVRARRPEFQRGRN